MHSTRITTESVSSWSFRWGLAAKAVFLVQLALPVWTQTKLTPPEFRIPHLSDNDLRLDGQLDEAQWTQAFESDTFFQTSPGENLPPSRRTEFRVFHTDRSLVIGIRCFDPQVNRVRRERYRRDGVPANAEGVTITLDPSGNAQRALWIRITPYNDVSDGLQDLVRGNMGEELDFEFHSVTRIHAAGYDVELEIPFASLPRPTRAGVQVWYLAVDRVIPREDLEMDSLVPLNRGSSDPRDFLARVSLSPVEATSSKPWHFLPTMVGFADRSSDSSADAQENQSTRKGEFELTGWWSPDPSTRATFTLNPDFSQVEANDVYQRINNRYPVFIPEKRPFFLDPDDPFKTSFQLVHTRTIVDPFLGLRFSTRQAGYSLYALSALERDTPAERFGLEGRPRNTAWNILATRWGTGSGSYGLLVTSTDHGEAWGRLVSFDANPRFGNLSITAQGARSWTHLGSPPPQEGSAVFIKGAYRVNSWLALGGSLRRISTEFQAPAGFEPQTGTERRTVYADLTFQAQGSQAFIKNYSLELVHRTQEDLSRVPIERFFQASQNLVLPHRFSIFSSFLEGSESFLGKDFGQRNFSLGIDWAQFESLGLSVSGSKFQTVLYNPSQPRAVRGEAASFSLRHTFRGLSISQQFTSFRLSEQYGGAWAAKQFSTQTILQWVFGQGLSLRIYHTWDRAKWMDYDLDNPTGYFQVLFTYQPSTFSRLLAGFNNRFDRSLSLMGAHLQEKDENRVFVKWVYKL